LAEPLHRRRCAAGVVVWPADDSLVHLNAREWLSTAACAATPCRFALYVNMWL
jgi:hypothetical protein